VNTNNVDELLSEDASEKLISEEERRLAVYPLGWESTEVSLTLHPFIIFSTRLSFGEDAPNSD
jgi:hypothetical protein